MSSALWMLLMSRESSAASMKWSGVVRLALNSPSAPQPAGNPKAVCWGECHCLYFWGTLSWSNLPAVMLVAERRVGLCVLALVWYCSYQTVLISWLCTGEHTYSPYWGYKIFLQAFPVRASWSSLFSIRLCLVAKIALGIAHLYFHLNICLAVLKKQSICQLQSSYMFVSFIERNYWKQRF